MTKRMMTKENEWARLDKQLRDQVKQLQQQLLDARALQPWTPKAHEVRSLTKRATQWTNPSHLLMLKVLWGKLKADVIMPFSWFHKISLAVTLLPGLAALCRQMHLNVTGRRHSPPSIHYLLRSEMPDDPCLNQHTNNCLCQSCLVWKARISCKRLC